jgi:hypothetical protein
VTYRVIDAIGLGSLVLTPADPWASPKIITILERYVCAEHCSEAHRRDTGKPDIPNLGPRVNIVDHQGKLIGRFGDTPAGTELGKFLAPHGLAVDSHGDVYVGEVSWTAWPRIYPGRPHPRQSPLSTLLLFEASISIALLTVVPVGMWAKVSISPPSELAREAGEAPPVGVTRMVRSSSSRVVRSTPVNRQLTGEARRCVARRAIVGWRSRNRR